jgi:hypothetical protein
MMNCVCMGKTGVDTHTQKMERWSNFIFLYFIIFLKIPILLYNKFCVRVGESARAFVLFIPFISSSPFLMQRFDTGPFLSIFFFFFFFFFFLNILDLLHGGNRSIPRNFLLSQSHPYSIRLFDTIFLVPFCITFKCRISLISMKDKLSERKRRRRNAKYPNFDSVLFSSSFLFFFF